MPDSSHTANELEDIDNAELKTQLKRWIEEEDIEANIQLQMKRNLIEKISRTTLGKKIALKLQTQHGIVLSPLVLVLNTLVAEFLYTQNCHFSLSIFTNEVPFKNTLPDFTRSPKFRLNHTELGEIFEALGIEHYEGLVEKYEKFGSDQGNRSLLFIVFKSILTAVKTQKNKIRQLQRAGKRSVANAQTLMQQVEAKKLHRNVEKLLHRLKAVGKAIAQLEEGQRQQQQQQQQQQGLSVADADQSRSRSKGAEEAPSLRMCSENVSRLVDRLESCTKIFEQLIESIQQQRNDDRQTAKATKGDNDVESSEPPAEQQKKYTEFLHELKTTEHGKKYVAKLQKQVYKLIEKEKSHLEAKYTRRVHQLEQEHKERAEKEVRTKLMQTVVLPDLSRHQMHCTETTGPRVDDESQHFMRKIDEKLNQLHQQEQNVDLKLAALRSDLQRQEQRQSNYFESLKAAKTKESKLQVLHNVERELMATFEDETNAIIQNAKQTIEQLEKESDKINNSFQRYLQKQREDKRRLIDEKVQIWTRYNDEKLELHQKQLDNVPDEGIEPSQITHAPVELQEAVPIVQASDGNQGFENPFRSFDPLKYLRGSRAIGKSMIDIATATSSDIGLQTLPEFEPTTEKPCPSPKVRAIESHEKIATKDSKLSEALAKDTRELRRSIEENLQKLEQMSKSKSNSSSGNHAVMLMQTPVKSTNERATSSGQTMPTVEPTTNRSLDDCSSTELGLSDGEIVIHRTGVDHQPTTLDTTKDLLAYTRQNKLNKCTSGIEPNVSLPQPINLTASLSDLSISTVSGTTKHSYEKSQSLDRELDRISTGARSNLSENSWT